jgi:TolB-like protein/Flp pilus assembly protein TadD
MLMKKLQNVSKLLGDPAMATAHQLGPFRLDGQAGILYRGAEPVGLGQRAVALLRVLVESAGAPVSKDALMEAGWAGLVVEEGNLTVQIAAVRRVLGQEPGGGNWIETLPRRGYRYIGPVSPAENESSVAAPMTETTPGLSDKPSIAVLPFQNLCDDPEQEYFADGVVEEIITGLARIKGVLVIARNSSFTYRGKAVDVKQIGRELGARYVLEGSVRKAGRRVRVSAQLIEAETGAHLWAERYDREFEDIFKLQDEITLSVVGAIEPNLREAEIERVKRKRPDSLDAYDLVLRAIPHVYPATPEEAVKGIPLLERALPLQADYADAHGLLAWCHETLFVRAGHSEEDRVAAIRHARAALAHGRDGATALGLGGFVVAMVEHDRATAFQAFEQALALSPSSALTLMAGAVALAYGGEAKRAIDYGERALRLSPAQDRANYYSHHALSIAFFLTGRYEEAANAARRAIQSGPNFSISHCFLAAPLAKLGRLEEAKMAASRVLALQPSFSSAGFCAALALPAALADPLQEAWRGAGLPT